MSRLELVEGDITTLDVEAIVNAANSALAGGGGVDGAIHRAAGRGLLEECRQHAPCPTGQARITGGHALRARYVIHTVGPVWQGGHAGEPALLASCYRASLRLAAERGVASVALPAISTGVYRYPLAAACGIAARTAREHADAQPTPGRIVFCTFGPAATAAMKTALVELGRRDLTGL